MEEIKGNRMWVLFQIVEALCFLVNLVESKLGPLVGRLELPGTSYRVSGLREGSNCGEGERLRVREREATATEREELSRGGD